jgi:tetratricopeptide (TPR) repeat protein
MGRLNSIRRRKISEISNQIEERINNILIQYNFETRFESWSWREKINHIQNKKNLLNTKHRGEWSENYLKLEELIELRNEYSLAHTGDHKNFNKSIDENDVKAFTDFIDFNQESELFNFKQNSYIENDINDDKYIGFNEPDYLYHGFWGRDNEISFLNDKKSDQFISLIYGSGGLGKTALADFFVSEYLKDDEYDEIRWISKKEQFLDLDTGKIKQGNDDNLKLLSEELDKSSKKILFVLDNIDDYLNQAENFVERYKNKFSFILTSRILHDFDFPFTKRHIESLDRTPSTSLIKKIAEINGDDEIIKMSEDELNDVVEKLSYSPLYIKWFMAARVNNSAIGISEFISRTKKDYANYIFSKVLQNISHDAMYCLRLMSKSSFLINQLMLMVIVNRDESKVDVHKALTELERMSLIRKVSDPNNKNIKSFQLVDNVKNLLDLTRLENKKLLEAIIINEEHSSELARYHSDIKRYITRNKSQAQFYKNEDDFILTSDLDALVHNEIQEIKNETYKNFMKDLKESEKLKDLQRKRKSHPYDNEIKRQITLEQKGIKAPHYTNQKNKLLKLSDLVRDNYAINFRLHITCNILEEHDESIKFGENACEISKKNITNAKEKETLNKCHFEYRQALYILGRKFDQIERFQEAFEIYEKLVELEPKDYAVRLSIAECCWGSGELKKGRKFLRKSFDLLENFIKENEKDSTLPGKVIPSFMRYTSLISKSIGHIRFESDSNDPEYYKFIGEFLNDLIHHAHLFDKQLLSKFLQTMFYFCKAYGEYCDNWGIENKISYVSYKEKLSKKFTEIGKFPFVELIQDFDPKSKSKSIKKSESNLSTGDIERKKQNIKNRLNNTFMKNAFKEKKIITGQVVAIFKDKVIKEKVDSVLIEFNNDKFALGLLKLSQLDIDKNPDNFRKGTEFSVKISNKGSNSGWFLELVDEGNTTL